MSRATYGSAAELVCGMTVASQHLDRRHSRARMNRRWEHALIVVGICLPVPLLAVTGLSIPLPATVERIAAALVPWANAATLDENQALASGVGGSIVFAPGERPAHETSDVPASSAAANPRPAEEPTGSSDGSSVKQDGGGGDGGSEDSGGGSGGSSGGSTTGDEDPTEPASPVQGAVDEVNEATKPVVDEAEGTVTAVVDTTSDTVDGVVSGLGK